MSSLRSKQRKLQRSVAELMQQCQNSGQTSVSEDDMCNRNRDNSLTFCDYLSVDYDETSSFHSVQSTDSSNEDDKQSLSFKDELVNWSIKHNVTSMAVDDLLKILKSTELGSNLPLSYKTLLKTPISYNILTWESGEYFHFGIRRLLNSLTLSHILSVKNFQNHISLNVGIDGLPISRSSKFQFWPILGMINEVKSSPFLIGLFYGSNKPMDCHQFLRAFIEEIKLLTAEGILINGINVSVSLKCIVADAPARSFLKGVKSHTGYYCCERCETKGTYDGKKVVYPELNSQLRTDQSFRAKSQFQHHNLESPLLELNLDMIKCFPLDYLHLVCLGVTKKMLHIWFRSKIPYKQSRLQQDLLSGMLVSYKRFFPVEFHRKPRSISELEYWKGSEYRNFLLYSGVVALKTILPQEKYIHFLTLSCGIRVLLSDDKTWYKFGKDCLLDFTQKVSHLYSEQFMSYNMHSLIHLADDADEFGSLENISAFPFENYMQELKRMVRSNSNSLVQVIRRVHESESLLGPLKCSQKICKDNCKISNKVGNNCVLLKDSRVGIVEAIDERQKTVSVRLFTQKHAFFDLPLDSSLLNIFQVSKLSQFPVSLKHSEIIVKCVLLPLENPTYSVNFPM